MVMFWVLGGVTLLALIVVVSLFLGKETDRAANGEAVPITDVSEIKGLSTEASIDSTGYSDEFPGRSRSGSPDELASAKSKLAELEAGHAGPQLSVINSFAKSDYSGSLIEPPVSGVASNSTEARLLEKVKELESQVTMISQKAIEQAEEAVRVIEELMRENTQIKMNQSTGAPDAQTAEFLVQLKERNGILESQLDLSSSKASQLETQVSLIKKELGQQLIEANSVIARLKAEGESQERITRESMLKEKEEMERLREAGSKKFREMEEDFIKTKEENLLLRDAKKLLEAKLSVVEDDLRNEITEAKDFASALAIQKEEQAQQIAHLEQDVTKLKELNSTLIDKAKILQYELNRHRAQASGLERVCANFKTQMEEMFGQVETAKRDNNRLLQERINLEAGVASLKSENVRLSERDKVYKHELDKTKEQIDRFEKLYKNFKTDVGGVSDGNGS
ncbi:MAG: hypothetical protein KA403_04355 [Candidatus Omnitrophica bacterium]|nr:hypothetical protein [Candidatus Omnitrophota bacterium]